MFIVSKECSIINQINLKCGDLAGCFVSKCHTQCQQVSDW